MTESEYIGKFALKFKKSCPDGFFYKIPDANDGQQRPYDGYWLTPQPGSASPVFTAFEAKIHEELSPWHFDKIEPHQIYNLRHVLKIGFPAFVILGIRCHETIPKDRKILGKDYAQIYADIIIPAGIIPGTLISIDVKTLDVRSLLADPSIKLSGRGVNEVHLSQERFEKYTKSNADCIEPQSEQSRLG